MRTKTANIRPALEGYRKMVGFIFLLGYLAWLAWMKVTDPALGTLAASAVTAFAVYVTGHVTQAATAKPSGDSAAPAQALPDANVAPVDNRPT